MKSGLPIECGRINLLRVAKWSDSSCETVLFLPFRFYPEKPVHVQITVNHMNLNDSKTVHDAITSWTEIINTKISLYAQCNLGERGRISIHL